MIMKTTLVLLAAMAFATAAFAVEVGQARAGLHRHRHQRQDRQVERLHRQDRRHRVLQFRLPLLPQPIPDRRDAGAANGFGGQRRRVAAREFREPKNISHRTPEQARAEMAAEKMDVTAWIDDSSGAIGHLYGMLTTPHMFVINKDGTLVYDGAIDNQPDPVPRPQDRAQLCQEAVNDLLAGKPIEVSQTKPYGCSVKYAD